MKAAYNTTFHGTLGQMAARLAKLTDATESGFDDINKSLQNLAPGEGPIEVTVPPDPAVLDVLGCLAAAWLCVLEGTSMKQINDGLKRLQASDHWKECTGAIESLGGTANELNECAAPMKAVTPEAKAARSEKILEFILSLLRSYGHTAPAAAG